MINAYNTKDINTKGVSVTANATVTVPAGKQWRILALSFICPSGSTHMVTLSGVPIYGRLANNTWHYIVCRRNIYGNTGAGLRLNWYPNGIGGDPWAGDYTMTMNKDYIAILNAGDTAVAGPGGGYMFLEEVSIP